MNTNPLFDRLYNDRSLFTNLNTSQTEQLLSWVEGQIEECQSEAEFQRLLEEIRLLNRYVAQGSAFDHLLVSLRHGSFQSRSTSVAHLSYSWRSTFPNALLY